MYRNDVTNWSKNILKHNEISIYSKDVIASITNLLAEHIRMYGKYYVMTLPVVGKEWSGTFRYNFYEGLAVAECVKYISQPFTFHQWKM